MVFKSQVLHLVEWPLGPLVLISKLEMHSIHPAPMSQDVFPHSQDGDSNVVLSCLCHSFPFPPASVFVEGLPDVTETRPGQDVCHFST